VRFFGHTIRSKAFASLPFALRKRLISRFLAGRSVKPLEIAEFARQTSPFYRELYGDTDCQRFVDLPLLVDDLLVRAAPEAVLTRGETERAVHAVVNSAGARGFFCKSDLLTMGASALAHPLAGELAAALVQNRFCLCSLPHSRSILGQCGERLAAFLGGCVLNVDGLSDEAAAAELALVTPSVVMGTADRFVRWMMTVKEQHADRFRAVTTSCRFFINLGFDGPMSIQRANLLEREFGLDVIDVFSDGYSFAFFSCRCGECHPAPHMFVELIQPDGSPAGRSGRLVVTDLTRRTMPLVRYVTPYSVSLKPCGCPFVGQSASVTCHGRTDEFLETPAGPVGRIDVEQQLHTHGLFSGFSIKTGKRGWTLRARSFKAGADAGAIGRAIRNRFGIQTRVVLTDSP